MRTRVVAGAAIALGRCSLRGTATTSHQKVADKSRGQGCPWHCMLGSLTLMTTQMRSTMDTFMQTTLCVVFDQIYLCWWPLEREFTTEHFYFLGPSQHPSYKYGTDTWHRG